MPVLTIFAGPNGSGKSSIIRRVDFAGRGNLLEDCIQRVHERVAQGGHNIPNNDVRRRYARSLSNVRQVVNIADETLIYDNSGPEPKLIAEVRFSSIVNQASELPLWARKLLESIQM